MKLKIKGGKIMSYSIFYKPLSIKFSNGLYMPMAEAGDNNCYTLDNKRARSWQNLRLNKKILYSRDEVLGFPFEENNKLKARYEDYTDDKSFGFFAGIAIYPSSTRNTPFSKYKNFFKKIIEISVSFSELEKIGIKLCYAYYDKEKDFDCQRFRINSEEEVFEIEKRAMSEPFYPYFYIERLDKYDYGSIEMLTKMPSKIGAKLKTDKGYVKDSTNLNIIFTDSSDEARFYKQCKICSYEMLMSALGVKSIEYVYKGD